MIDRSITDGDDALAFDEHHGAGPWRFAAAVDQAIRDERGCGA
jgi:hypothetical protein